MVFPKPFRISRCKNIRRQELPAFLREIEKQDPVKFFYQEDWIAFYEADGCFNGYTVRAMLDEAKCI